jgi:hypothetical protein
MILIDFILFQRYCGLEIRSHRSNPMTLRKLNDNTFIDPDQLLYVLFEHLDSDPKATLLFISGQEVWIGGNAVEELHSVLNPGAQAPSSTPTSPFQIRDTFLAQFSEMNSDSFSPMIRNKGWYYRADSATSRGFFMAFVNAKGSCSLRMFDAKTGTAFPKQYRPGNFQDQFRELIQGAVELTVTSQPNLERDCKERLPQSTLDVLRSQVS